MKAAYFRGLILKKAIARCAFVMTRLTCLGIAKVAFRLHIEGQEYVPLAGPVILAANHVSYIDPVIIGIAVRRPICFMAKKELFRVPLFGWLIRQFGAFPVNRHRTNLQAFKLATALLEAGEVVAIFPEGTRGDGMELQPAKAGIGLIAARTGAPVVPIFHKGTGRVFPKGAWFPRPYHIAIKFGMPCRFADQRMDETDDPIASFSRIIMKKIAALKGSVTGDFSVPDDKTYATGDAMLMKKRGINEPT